MALKPITLRLDEEEYEELREHLSKFGDPDINVGYVLRAYVRDLNRALPFLLAAGWDLKNYFGFLGIWLKQIGTMTDMEVFTKSMSPWQFWAGSGTSPQPAPEASEDAREKEQKRGGKEKGGDKTRR